MGSGPLGPVPPSNVAYNATTWNGNRQAASKNAIRDQFVAAATASLVADCTVGPCLDGSSDGGTYVRVYDGDSHYGEFQVPNIGANVTYTMPSATATIAGSTVAQYGTGSTTFTDGGILVGAGTGTFEAVAVGLTTQILVGGGAGTNPAWGTDLPTAITIGASYVYRVGGTDVSDADVVDTLTITNIAQVQDISASASEINTPLDGALVTLVEFQQLEAIGATTLSANQWAVLGGIAETLTSAELDILDGVTGVTAAELSYIGDVTSLIQAQIDLKAPLAGPSFTGTIDLTGGSTLYKVETVTDADGFTMTAAQGWGGVVYATGAGTIVMPAVVAGMAFTVEAHAAAAVVLNPDATGTEDTIRLDGAALAQGDSITSTSAVTDMAVCTYYAADTWSCRTTSWTDTN